MRVWQQLLRFHFLEQRRILALAMPMMVAQLIYAIGPFVNTWLAAKLGCDAIAAQALVSILFFTLGGIGWGMLSAVGVLTARYYGARRYHDISQVVQQAWLLAIIIALPCTLLMWFAPKLLLILGQNPAIVNMTVPYFHTFAWAMPALFLEAVMVEFLIGLGKTTVIMIMSIIEIPINITLKYLFIFGGWGLSPHGLVGIGYGIAVVVWGSLIIYTLYIMTNKSYRHYQLWWLTAPKWQHLKEISHIGWPVGLTFFIEIGFFMTIALLAGRIGSEILAANQIAMQFLGFVSALLFGIGQGATAYIGQTIGRNTAVMATRASLSSIHVMLYFSITIAAFFYLLPGFIVGIDFQSYHPPAVIHYARQFLRFAAIFIVFDGIRTAMTAVLLAHKDTRFCMYTSLFCFWFVAFGSGYILAFYCHLQGYGLWCGSTIGVLFGVLLLLKRLVAKQLLFTPSSGSKT